MSFQLGDRLVPDIWIHLLSAVSAHIVRSMILYQSYLKRERDEIIPQQVSATEDSSGGGVFPLPRARPRPAARPRPTPSTARLCTASSQTSNTRSLSENCRPEPYHVTFKRLLCVMFSFMGTSVNIVANMECN